MRETIELKLVDFLNLSTKFPNDSEFGKNCRYLFDTVEINKSCPNDMDLGKLVRKILVEIQK